MSQQQVWSLKIRQLGGSMCVTLPREVVRTLHLEEGDLCQWSDLPGRGFQLVPYKGITALPDVDENMPRRRRRLGEMLALARLRPLHAGEFNNRSLFRNGYHERVREHAINALFASARERMERQPRHRSSLPAKELDKRFDDGEDMSDYFDWSSARRPNQQAPKKDEPPVSG